MSWFTKIVSTISARGAEQLAHHRGHQHLDPQRQPVSGAEGSPQTRGVREEAARSRPSQAGGLSP